MTLIIPWGGISDSYVAPVEIVEEPVEVVPEEVAAEPVAVAVEETAGTAEAAVAVEETAETAEPLAVAVDEIAEAAEEITIEADEEVISEESAYSGLANTEVTSKVMTMGTTNIKRGAYIYMGAKAVIYKWTDERPTWIVLDPTKTNTGDTGMFLLSKELISNFTDPTLHGDILFNRDSQHLKSGYFDGSDAHAWCKTFLRAVFYGERGAILETLKNDAEFIVSGLKFCESYNLNNDKVFFLSAEEAMNSSYGFTSNGSRKAVYTVGNPCCWWLRSQHVAGNTIIPQGRAGIVNEKGALDFRLVDSRYAARPAFNLNSNSVIFSSAAPGGKASGATGAASLQQVNLKMISAWKFTLLDDGSTDAAGSGHSGFNATKTSFDGTTLKFTYSGAKTGNNEYVSAIITNAVNSGIKYYGRIVQNSESGTATIDLSGKYASGDRLWVFAEQYNGDYETDYCSKLVELSLDKLIVPVTGVTLNKTTTFLNVGSTEQLTATVAPSNATNKNVTWSSSDTSVATVNGEGLVTGKKAGTATITVKTEDGNRVATCKVIVEDSTVPVTGVTLSKTTLTLTLGITSYYDLAETVAPSNATNKNVTWKSSNENVVTVTSGGRVRPKGVGTATITVTTEDGKKTATCKVTVENPTVAVTGITLNKTALTLETGKSEKLTATITPSNASNKDISWQSSNRQVATVSGGTVTAVGVGTATIVARTVDGNKFATCTVTVTAASGGGETKTGTWKKDSNGWWYKRADGTYPKNKWEKIDGKWYHFDDKGYMQTGWFKEGGKWYYLDSSGAMVTGWKKISSKWYYFNSSGVMQTGWQKIDGKWYYFESSGAMLANTSKKIGNKTYHFDKNGVCTNP